MARFRKYKNGIFGHRYKGYYVVRNEYEDRKKTYSIIDENNQLIMNDLKDYWDCEWEIDKLTASTELLEILKALYGEEIVMLSKFFVDLMEKENKEGLSDDEQDFYYWVTKIRARKADNKPY